MDRRQAVAGFLLAALLVVAGCSDDVTQKGYAKRDDVIGAANSVCQQDLTNEKAIIAAYKARFASSTPSAADARDFLITTVSPDADATSAGMHNIAKPAKDTQKWLDALVELDKELYAFKAQIDSDPVALAKSVAAADPNKGGTAGQMFVDFGAKDCASL